MKQLYIEFQFKGDLCRVVNVPNTKRNRLLNDILEKLFFLVGLDKFLETHLDRFFDVASFSCIVLCYCCVVVVVVVVVLCCL